MTAAIEGYEQSVPGLVGVRGEALGRDVDLGRLERRRRRVRGLELLAQLLLDSLEV